MDRHTFLTRTDLFSVDNATAAALPSWRHHLNTIGYTEDTICAALGLPNIANFKPKRTWLYHHQMGTTPLEDAIRLFLLGLPLSPAQVHAILPAFMHMLAVTTGLILENEAFIVAPVSIYPVKERLYVTDWFLEPTDAIANNPWRVMALGNDSRALVGLVQHSRATTVLDLCTGSGVVAIEAALHGKEAVGVDINPRAVAYARFNALLNNATVRFELGDLFEPIDQESFELVSVNPPFVPTPYPPALLFRDGGQDGEAIIAKVIAEVTSYLEPGGICAIKTDLAHHTDLPYDQKVLGWLGSEITDTHTIILSQDGRSAQNYVFAHVGEENEDAALEWLEHYAQQGIDEIGDGFIVLSRAETAAGHASKARVLPLGEFNLTHLTENTLSTLVERVKAIDENGAAPEQKFGLRCGFGSVELFPGGPWGGLQVGFPLAHVLADLYVGGVPVELSTIVAKLESWGFQLEDDDTADLKRTLGRLWWAGYIEPYSES